MLPIALTPRTIPYHPDSNILTVRWQQNAELADYQAMLTTDLHHGYVFWLRDIRRCEEQAPQLSEWASDASYTAAVAAGRLGLFLYLRALSD